MKYRNFGPYDLPVDNDNNLDFSLNARKQFWARVEKRSEHDLQIGRGCYVFAMRAGKGMTPWYVGQSKSGFKGEVFQRTKQDHYVAVKSSYKKGTAILFLITRFTNGGKIMKGQLPKPEADYIERFFIVQNLRKEPPIDKHSGSKLRKETWLCRELSMIRRPMADWTTVQKILNHA